MNKKLLGVLVFATLASASQSGLAAIVGTGTVNIDFPATNMLSASYGYGANLTPQANGLCPDTGGATCYVEEGILIGSPKDSNGSNHIHKVASAVGGGTADKSLAYHADSAGIYIRALDRSAFNLASMVFKAPISADNLIYGTGGVTQNPYGLSDQPGDIGLLGAQEKWEIFGYSNAINPNITTTNTSYKAYASIANGFSGTVGTGSSNTFKLGQAFSNVSAVWINYKGYPVTPTNGIVFDLKVDNITLSAPAAAPVPVPAAVWLFGSGLLGMMSFGRRKAA